jgi:hypothetical protein
MFSKKFNALVIFITIVSVIIDAQEMKGFSLQGPFKYCETNDIRTIWDVSDTCAQIAQDVPISNSQEYYLLVEKSREVNGIGWLCQMQRFTWTTFKDFIGTETHEFTESYVKLSREECKMMVELKKCKGDDDIENLDMQCSGQICQKEKRIDLVFKWLQTISVKTYSCLIKPQKIIASTVDTLIYIDMYTTQCHARDLKCQTLNSIVIWEASIVSLCSFERVKMVNLTSYGKDLLINNLENKMFKINGKHTICKGLEIQTLSTNEGFFLTTEIEKAKLLQQGANEIKILDDLMLSEIDWQSFELIRAMSNMAMVMNLKVCQMYKSLNRIFSKFDDEFVQFYDALGNELLLYSDMSRVMVPSCKDIMEIYVIKETKNCYKDFPIQINVNDVIVDAFLTQEGIIRRSSKLVHCKNYMISLRLKNMNQTLVKRGNKAWIQSEHEFVHYKINLNNVNITDFNYNHDPDIINGFDVINALANTTIVNDGESNYHIRPDSHYDSKSSIAALAEHISDLPGWLIDLWVYVGSFICLILFIIIFIKILMYCVSSAMQTAVV